MRRALAGWPEAEATGYIEDRIASLTALLMSRPREAQQLANDAILPIVAAFRFIPGVLKKLIGDIIAPEIADAIDESIRDATRQGRL